MFHIKPKSTLIMYHCYFNGRRLVLSTSEHCDSKDWSTTKQRPKSNPTLTTLLNRFDAKVNEIHLKLRAEFETVTPESLRATVQRDILTGGKRETLVEFADRSIKESKLKAGSLSVQQSAYKIFKAYPGVKNFNDISPTWMTGFKQAMEVDGYSSTYISLTISVIKSWMNQAGQQGLHRNESYKTFTMAVDAVDSIYLTSDELSAIRKADLSPALDRVRSRFLISCYTGLRFSDNLALTPDSIRDGFIHNRNIKTGSTVIVPISPVVQEILDRYPNGLPKSVTNAQANISLKKIGKISGITAMINGVPKYELICTHTGRRSFSSNAILAGIPSTAVRKITGHATEASFNRYIRISQLENAEALQNHSFFTK